MAKRKRTDREIVLSAIELMGGRPQLGDLVRWLSGMDGARVRGIVRSMIEDGALVVGLNWELVVRK